MRLGRQRAQRHRGADETFDDLCRRFDLVDRNRLRTFLDRQQLAQRLSARHAGQTAPLAIRLGIAGLGRLLGGPHRERVVRVVLAGLAESHPAVVGHLRRPRARQALDVIEVDAADAGWHGGEAHLHHLGAEPERLEDLAAAVAADARDAHLGHDLQEAGLEGFAVAGGGFVARRREREVRVNRTRADGDQACDVVDIDRVARDRHDVGGHPSPGGEQVRVHGADRERHRDRKPNRACTAVAQCDHSAHLIGLPAQALQRVAQRLVRRVRRVEDDCVLQHAGQLGGAEDGRV